MEDNTKKIVLIKHPNCETQFIFEVPEGIKLNAGDMVLCKTAKSPKEVGTCITPSFELDEPTLMLYYHRTFAQLKPVIGWLKPIMFEETTTWQLHHASCAAEKP